MLKKMVAENGVIINPYHDDVDTAEIIIQVPSDGKPEGVGPQIRVQFHKGSGGWRFNIHTVNTHGDMTNFMIAGPVVGEV